MLSTVPRGVSGILHTAVQQAVLSCSDARKLVDVLMQFSPTTLRYIHHTNFANGSTNEATSDSAGRPHPPKKLLYLGTPDFSAAVLRQLVEASQQPDSGFEVCAVVTRRPLSGSGSGRSPGSRGSASQDALQGSPGGSSSSSYQGSTTVHLSQPPPRLRRVTPSSVEVAARDLGISHIMTPPNAKDPSFLEEVRDLSPHLALTAAYGCILPQPFLDTPPLGTLNIHPSLLPQYRGAAPVQRALQAGARVTGVSVAYSVLACDAGPVLAQQQVEVEPDEQAHALTHRLFQLGARLLLHNMPHVLTAAAQGMAVPQDHSLATHAAKLSKSEAHISLELPASVIHNHVRAFAGWPGTRVSVAIKNHWTDGQSQPMELTLLKTRVAGWVRPVAVIPASIAANALDATAGTLNAAVPGTTASKALNAGPSVLQPMPDGLNRSPELSVRPGAAKVKAMVYGQEVPGREAFKLHKGLIVLHQGRMLVPCGDHELLEVMEVRAVGPGYATLSGQQFMAGIGGRALFVPWAAQAPESD